MEKEPVVHVSGTSGTSSTLLPLDHVEGYGGAYGLTFLEAFIRWVQEGDDPPASGRDALHIARIIEAAYESSRSGNRMTVPTT